MARASTRSSHLKRMKTFLENSLTSKPICGLLSAFEARSEILVRARILFKFDLLGRSARAVSQDFTPAEQVLFL